MVKSSKSGIRSGSKIPSPENDMMSLQREANAEWYRSLGAEVTPDGGVVLYHNTTPEVAKRIEREGFVGSTAPINGGMSDLVKERSFFGHDREWVEKTWQRGLTSAIVRVVIPAEYLHQAGKNTAETYVEGNIRNHSGVWIPDTLPTSTAWDRIRVKRYKKKHGIK